MVSVFLSKKLLLFFSPSFHLNIIAANPSFSLNTVSITTHFPVCIVLLFYLSVRMFSAWYSIIPPGLVVITLFFSLNIVRILFSVNAYCYYFFFKFSRFVVLYSIPAPLRLDTLLLLLHTVNTACNFRTWISKWHHCCVFLKFFFNKDIFILHFPP